MTAHCTLYIHTLYIVNHTNIKHTCVVVCMAQTPQAQPPSSLLGSSLPSLASASIWPLPFWPAPLRLHHRPPRLRPLPHWERSHSRFHPPADGPCRVECERHSKPSCAHWTRCRWRQSRAQAPSSCRARLAVHTSHGKLCNSWPCDTGYMRQRLAAYICSMSASSAPPGCVRCCRSAPGRPCWQSTPAVKEERTDGKWFKFAKTEMSDCHFNRITVLLHLTVIAKNIAYYKTPSFFVVLAWHAKYHATGHNVYKNGREVNPLFCMGNCF